MGSQRSSSIARMMALIAGLALIPGLIRETFLTWRALHGGGGRATWVGILGGVALFYLVIGGLPYFVLIAAPRLITRFLYRLFPSLRPGENEVS